MKRLDAILSKATTGERPAQAVATPTPETAPLCPLCDDAGFVRRERPVDHPDFGRAEPCECVLRETAAVRTARMERVGNLTGLGRLTFANLDATSETSSARNREAVEAARRYAESPEGFLTLIGPSASGKTHLAAAIGHRRIERGEPALFMVVPDLLDLLRAGFETADQDYQYAPMFDYVRNAPLLILDDIDAAAGTPWAKEKLFQLVNGRSNESLPTIFTVSSLDDLDARLKTRLADRRLATVLELEASREGSYASIGGMTHERLRRMQFKNFDARGTNLAEHERASLQSALRVAMAYAENPQGWLVVQGANGCGKTHLAAGIANRALRDGRHVLFAGVADLLDDLRRDDLFQDVREVDLLVLDDFGMQERSTWAKERLFQVVNYRTLAELPTVVTTDRGQGDLQRTYPRIWARIGDPTQGAYCFIDAPHYRLGRGANPA
jgi:DNA replication protein DnaC